jgi:hypothetical protein
MVISELQMIRRWRALELVLNGWDSEDTGRRNFSFMTRLAPQQRDHIFSSSEGLCSRAHTLPDRYVMHHDATEWSIWNGNAMTRVIINNCTCGCDDSVTESCKNKLLGWHSDRDFAWSWELFIEIRQLHHISDAWQPLSTSVYSIQIKALELELDASLAWLHKRIYDIFCTTVTWLIMIMLRRQIRPGISPITIVFSLIWLTEQQSW